MREREDTAQQDNLQDVVRASVARFYSNERFRREVLFAYEGGSSFRAIGDAIGMSHSSVRTIVQQQRAWRDRLQMMIEEPLPDVAPSRLKRVLAERRRLARTWRLSLPETEP